VQTSKSVSLLLRRYHSLQSRERHTAVNRQTRGQWCHNGPAGTALLGGSDAVPKPRGPSGITFAAPPATGDDGFHRLRRFLLRPAGCERSDWPYYFVELVNNHYAVYTKQGIPVVQMTGGEFWGQAGVPFGVNESPVDPPIVFRSHRG